MKKIVFVCGLLVILLLAGCGSDGDAVTAATSPDFPPFEYLENGEVVGIEVDILKKIADKLELEITFEQMDFESVVPGVQAGKFDIGMSGITITEERKKNADFTQPYFMASQAIVVTPDSPIKGKADLKGKKIAVQTATTAEEFCMEEGYEVLAYAANNDAAAALKAGKTDAWVVDNEVAVAMAADQGLVVLAEAMTQEPYGFCFAKGSELTEQFDQILGEMLKDGTVEGIFKEYGVPYVSPLQ